MSVRRRLLYIVSVLFVTYLTIYHPTHDTQQVKAAFASLENYNTRDLGAAEPDVHLVNVGNFGRYNVLIVGAGLSGAVLAERHAFEGDRVLVIDKRPHIAGNCYDYIDESSQIRISNYGAHILHTNSERVWEYVNQFSEWVPWKHRVLAYVDGKYVPVPVNIHTVNALFRLNISSTQQMDKWLKSVQVRPPSGEPRNSREMALSKVGRVLYDKLFSPYTRKQWNTDAVNLDPMVADRISVRNNFNNKYFSDTYQALPRDGYTAFVKKMLSNPLITVKLNVDYFDLPRTNIMTYYTGPIDRFYGQSGLLEYRSLRFDRVYHDNIKGTVLPASVVNYPSPEFPYTREIEYKHFLNQTSNRTVIFREYPVSEGEPIYPVFTERNLDLYTQLVARTTGESRVTFVGRLANYKYFSMAEAIENALKIFEQRYAIHVLMTVSVEEDLDTITQLCDKIPEKLIGWYLVVKTSAWDAGLSSAVLKQYVTGICFIASIAVVNDTESEETGNLAWLDYMMKPDHVGAYNVFLRSGYNVIFVDQVDQVIRIKSNYQPLHPVRCEFGLEFKCPNFSRPTGHLATLKARQRICPGEGGEFAATRGAILEMTKNWKDLLWSLRAKRGARIDSELGQLWMSLFLGKVENIKNNGTAHLMPSLFTLLLLAFLATMKIC